MVDGPVVLPDLMIEFPNSTVISEEGANSLAHMFSPLRMSDRGQYTCTATIIIPQAEIADHQSTVIEAVVVVCKYELITRLTRDLTVSLCTLCRCLSSVPV